MDPEPLSADAVELWREADRVLDLLLDLPPAERCAALGRIGPAPAVRERVEQLLAAAEDARQRFEGATLRFAPDAPQVAAVFRPGARIGRWVLDEEVGRGGMSVVFAARDPQHPERRVAVKLLAGVFASGTGQQHLRREQQALSRLSHPLIVPLIEAGVLADGTPWLAMALVDGTRIDAWCFERQLDVPGRVRLMAEVADAVAHAHRALVVHRDLKPANVLIDRDGRVRLLDFGIAGVLDPDGERTRTLLQALTPDYAAPEQFENAPASTAIDVYGLGALLHRLLTGSAPARRMDADAPIALPSDTVGERAFAGPAGAGHARKALRGDLDAILLKALEHDPARRYPGAGEFGADLRAWLDGRPASAQRPTVRYRVGKFVRRHRGAVGIAAIAVVAVLGALAIALWQSGRAAVAAREAELRATEAARESARAEAVSGFLVEVFGTAAAGAPRDRLPTVPQLLEAAERRVQEAFLREPETRARLLLALGEVQVSLGRLERGESMLAEALSLTGGASGARASDVARIESELARVRFRRGEFESALDLTASALARLPPTRTGDSGLDLHQAIIDVRVGALNSLGRVEDAEALARAHWDAVRTAPDAGDALISGAAYLVAITLNAQGESGEALGLLELARERSRDVAGRWEERLSIINALASALSARGRHAEALAARQEALAMVTEGYPEGHVRIAQTRNNLASDLNLVGRTEEALLHFGEALAIMRDALGDAHPSVAAAHNNRGRALAELGRYQQALDDYLLADAIVARLAPASDRRLQTVRLSRADALIELRRFAEAETLLRDLEQVGAATSDDVQRAMREIVWSRLHAGRRAFAAAKAHALASAEAAARAFPDGSGLAALALGHAARAAAALGESDEALRHIEAGNQAFAGVGSEVERSGLRFVRERHALLLQLGRADAALRFMEADLARLRQILPQHDPRLDALASIVRSTDER